MAHVNAVHSRHELGFVEHGITPQSQLDKFADYLTSNHETATRYFGTENYASAVDNLYNFRDSEVFRRVKSVEHKVKSLFDGNVISYLHNRHDIQHCAPKMSRYLVHDARIRRAQYKGLLQPKLEDTYEFDHHNIDFNPDYHRVHNGMCTIDEETGDVEYTNYICNFDLSPDEHLTFNEQCDIRDTMTEMHKLMDQGYNPFSDIDEKI